MSEISVRLGLLRIERGLSQRELAERAGLRRDTISALERGKSQGIEFDTLAKLCYALGVLPSDILELGDTAHVVPILGGPDEDEIIIARLAEWDGAGMSDQLDSRLAELARSGVGESAEREGEAVAPQSRR